jgi:hypothetical protein
MFTSLWIWKHRSAAIFDNLQPSVASLLDTIKAEAKPWAHAVLLVELYGVVLVLL